VPKDKQRLYKIIIEKDYNLHPLKDELKKKTIKKSKLQLTL
jgi:hypothetical protein